MSSSSTNLIPALESLLSSLVPSSTHDEPLRNELVAHCQEILNSRIGQSHEPDIGHLADLIKRHLLQSSPSGTASLKFTNLLSRLLDQPVLSRKHAAIHFLNSLTSSPPPISSVSFLPSLAPPPPTRSTPSPLLPHLPKSTPPIVGKSKAERLREYRLESGRPHLPEHLLIRDTLYLLQGISGKYIQLSSQNDSNQLEFADSARYIISVPTKALIHRLSEVGYLYSRVDSFVREREHSSGVGMIEQSLCHHLQTKLTEYYRLIAVLESQMPTANSIAEASSASIQQLETGLTLRRLDVWINEWRLRMRMMSVCVEGARRTTRSHSPLLISENECAEAHGGALVNLIHSYTNNGDPFIRQFTDQLLEEVSKPFFMTLHRWLFSGELYDPFDEFFVAAEPGLAHVHYMHPSSLTGNINQLANGDFELADQDGVRDRRTEHSIWQTKYRFQQEMLPMFVGEAFGRKIFSTGKSLNFIRYSCHDSDWVVTREKMTNAGRSLKYSDIAGLERSIDAAYSTASQRLFDVFLEKFRLLDHLCALKNYMMLGHGDFADRLMSALGPSLSRPANTLFRHNLTATLETAIRSSNAQSDPPDVLRRLDARMLEYSHGEIGWDVFTLEYKIEAPIDTVIDLDAMVVYLKLFNHLWKMKRIEGTLSRGWMRVAGGARTTFLRLPDLEESWHKIRIVMAEMIHVIKQLQAYCQLEVIECSWKILVEFLKKREGDLDAMISAHRTYLDRLIKKVLLLSPKAGREENNMNQVKEIFTLILQFQDSVENFYNFCLSESTRRDRKLDADRGLYTGPVDPNSSLEENVPRLLQPVNDYSSQFSEKVQTLVAALQTHPDLDCRFLGVRLNFSEFYRGKQQKEKERGDRAETVTPR
ncbi:hypothetical protein D9757_002759 [Collybiopsis confluens]|uniref:Spindle pole body component n=1 Tax=Collybiopsis confluens TaxID=2823264 RepID=A0A8H5MEC0_9AGAR|nr:hypothetical protein D9757_002759 [Collybiopsis confluens]